MTTLEKFKEECSKMKLVKSDEVKHWWNVYIEQDKYGKCYKPIIKGIFNKKYICPHCSILLMEKLIKKGGVRADGREFDKYLLQCKKCNYEYALAK